MSPIPSRITQIFLLISAVTFLAAASAGFGQSSSSASFVLSQSTVNSGNSRGTSASFVLDGSVSQSATVGRSTSSGLVLESGFWTSLSTRSILRVEGTGSGEGTVSATGITCALSSGVPAGDCTESFLHGATTDLVAAPLTSNRFDGWTGCDTMLTSSLPNDTCRITLRQSRNVSVGFTLLGSVGDRVWRDVNGDGLQDPGEPGLANVDITINDGIGLNATAMTDADGNYAFVDVPPGSYTLTVNPASLPPGVVPSADPDGTGTPNSASLSIIDGQIFSSADFGYQPLVDLAITLQDAEDPLPGGQNLIYTITVQNLGASYASGVEVANVLPTPLTLVATDGCAGDPNGAPICTLGDLAAGASTSFTLEAAVALAPPSSVTHTATVSSLEMDTAVANNSASETTALDDGPPEVASVVTDAPRPGDADGLLESCDTVHDVSIQRLGVTFDEPMLDPPGDTTLGDVTQPMSWRLIGEGQDLRLDTTTCVDPPGGDDLSVTLDGITYDGSSAWLTPEAPLAAGRYRLIACGSGPSFLRDPAGNALDGDGDLAAGGDFTIDFRADPGNRLANGRLDCGLDAWIVYSQGAEEVTYSDEDVRGSDDSGSVAMIGLTESSELSIGQCVPMAAQAEHTFSAWIRLETSGWGPGLSLGCEIFEQEDCGGEQVGPPAILTVAPGDTGMLWTPVSHTFVAPEDSVSALCAIRWSDPLDLGFDARVDGISLIQNTLIFADGFESGDATAWSATHP